MSELPESINGASEMHKAKTVTEVREAFAVGLKTFKHLAGRMTATFDTAEKTFLPSMEQRGNDRPGAALVMLQDLQSAIEALIDGLGNMDCLVDADDELSEVALVAIRNALGTEGEHP